VERQVNVIENFYDDHYLDVDEEDQSEELYDMLMAEKRKQAPPVVTESAREERLKKRRNTLITPPEITIPVPDEPMPEVVSEPRTEKYQMKVGIREEAGIYPIMHALKNLQVPISVAELLATSPELRKTVAQSLTPRRQERKINVVATEKSKAHTTSLSAAVTVEGVAARALIDTGAAISTISNDFRKRLGFDIGDPVHFKIKGIDGRKFRPLGQISGFPLNFGQVTVPITVAVIDAPHYEVIIGNDWLTKMAVDISYQTTPCPTLQISWQGRSQKVKTECYDLPRFYEKVEMEEEKLEEEELEEEDLEEEYDVCAIRKVDPRPHDSTLWQDLDIRSFSQQYHTIYQAIAGQYCH